MWRVSLKKKKKSTAFIQNELQYIQLPVQLLVFKQEWILWSDEKNKEKKK